MHRDDLLNVLTSLMDACDNPDLWEELLYIKHNQEEFSDKDICKRLFELALEYIDDLKGGKE